MCVCVCLLQIHDCLRCRHHFACFTWNIFSPDFPQTEQQRSAWFRPWDKANEGTTANETTVYWLQRCFAPCLKFITYFEFDVFAFYTTLNSNEFTRKFITFCFFPFSLSLLLSRFLSSLLYVFFFSSWFSSLLPNTSHQFFSNAQKRHIKANTKKNNGFALEVFAIKTANRRVYLKLKLKPIWIDWVQKRNLKWSTNAS